MLEQNYIPSYSRYQITAYLLVAISTLLQATALTGFLTRFSIDEYPQRIVFGSIEMLLILLLLGNGWSIWKWSKNTAQTPFIQTIAKLCFISLALCVLGDVINRNYFDLYYQHNSNIQHSYLADSVWFFFPGYAIFIYAAYLACKHTGKVSTSTMLVSAGGLATLGLLSYLDLHHAGTGIYITALTGSYAMLIAIVSATAFWLIRAYSWQAMKWIAIGAILATIADALIGNFWIYRDGYYPTISYINWIIYFTSQALIQQLPIKLAQVTP